MERAKAVVLARGLGTRMREDDASVTVDAAQAEAAARGLKAMMPVVLDPPAGAGGPPPMPAPATSAPAASASAATAPPATVAPPTVSPATASPASGRPITVPSGTVQPSTVPSAREPAANAPTTTAPAARPFLDYILSALADAGYTDICLVIGPDHDRVRHYYTLAAPPRRTRIAFAVQAEPRGTADALLAAEAFAAQDDVLVINGDNYYPVGAMRALRELGAPGTVLFTPEGLTARGNIAAERIRAFAVGALTPDACLADIVEKPDEATLRAMTAASGGVPLVSMNCWRLPPAIFDACRKVRPSPRGELELSLAIRDAVRTQGLRLKVLRSEEGVLDLSRRADIQTVAAHLRDVVVQP